MDTIVIYVFRQGPSKYPFYNNVLWSITYLLTKEKNTIIWQYNWNVLFKNNENMKTLIKHFLSNLPLCIIPKISPTIVCSFSVFVYSGAISNKGLAVFSLFHPRSLNFIIFLLSKSSRYILLKKKKYLYPIFFMFCIDHQQFLWFYGYVVQYVVTWHTLRELIIIWTLDDLLIFILWCSTQWRCFWESGITGSCPALMSSHMPYPPTEAYVSVYNCVKYV